MNKLSVAIITYNEENNIERCLKSLVSVADEIVVLDSFSTDNTKAICERYQVRFFEQKFAGYSEQKNDVIALCSFENVLSIDADEVLSDTLQQAIQIAKEKGFDGAYSMNRLTNYCGKWIRHCGWYPDTKIRLFQKSNAQWIGKYVHETLSVGNQTKITLLKGDLLHYSYTDIADHSDRANKYTTLSAERYFEQGKKSSQIKLIFSSKFCFFKDYVLKGGWKEGWRGLVICRIAAHSTFLKYAKLKEFYEKTPKTTLIVTTYNRPDALEMVLLSIQKQTRKPDEVIIADDGSTSETASLIEAYKNKFEIPLIHCWQKDEGFQLSRIRNKAIAQSSGNYIIMVDGDIVLNKNFVKDHIKHAAPNQFIQGSRVLVTEKTTYRNIKNKNISFTPFTSGITNRLNACRFRYLSNRISKNYGKKDHNGVRGCNMSFWKEDVLKVNGFDENFVGWGREDSEFVVRLLNQGVERKNIKFGAIAFHLWHKENNNSSQELLRNQDFLEKTISEKKTVCEKGIRQ